MSKSVMLATDIILDMAMSERPEHEAADALMASIESGKTEAYLCATSLEDIYSVLSAYMGEEDARAYVLAMLDSFELCPIGYTECALASLSNEPNFKDALVRACAEGAHLDYIISRDTQAFNRSHIKRVDAMEYLAH